MRTAVALPSLPPAAPLRRRLDGLLEGLVESGLEVEAFAEMGRVREGGAVPVFHYLRFEERHGVEPFEAALWPLGRDARTWEPAWILSRRYSGTVWVLDEPLHHVAIGGIAMPGHWGPYGRLLEDALEDPGPAFSLFAAGWASRVAYRVHDPLRRRLQRRGGVVAAVPGGGGEWVPLPTIPPPDVEGRDEGDAEGGGVAILSMDVIRPGAVMAALGEVLAARPDLDVSIGIPEPTYHVRVAPAAHRAGIAGRVRWLLSPGAEESVRELRRASAAVFLDVDMNAADRALLEHGLGLGKASIGLDTPSLGDVADPPLLKLRPGAALGPGLATALDGLLGDPELRRALGRAGADWYAGRPGPREVADRLREHLGAGPVRERSPGEADGPWAALVEGMRAAAVPGTAAEGSRELVETLLRQALPGAARGRSARRPS